MAGWLRSLPDIQLWTEDPDQPGGQIGFVACSGHFRGHLDGIISGLYQAPQTPHVWEHKVCNETKWNKLVKLIQQHGEKAALALWDAVYYAQAQVYMHQMDLTRHYLTVGTPGNRQLVSCRTEYRAQAAKALFKKAEQIITADRPPLKISETPAWWQCKTCSYIGLCHYKEVPLINCRTCSSSTAVLNEAQPWTCELNKPEINGNQQGCEFHSIHPDLLDNHAAPVNANPKTGVIEFYRKDGGGNFKNGKGEILSVNVSSYLGIVNQCAPLCDDDVLTDISINSEIPVENLLSGNVEDSEWPRFSKAVSGFWDRWNHDTARMDRLRALIELIDSAYFQIMDRGAK